MPRSPTLALPWFAGTAIALVKPSLVDLFFPILLLATLGHPQAWQALLSDGDTGWHIRTGDLILQSGTVPRQDPFSFSRPGEPWFAWEWLSDVVFAQLHRWHGLEAVAAFSGFILCLSAVCLLSWLLRRGVGLWVGLAVVLAAVSASTIHYLARPHIFSLLFVTLALWLLDEDRHSRGAKVWLLVPLSALWANLHAGFVSWLAIIGLLTVVCAISAAWASFWRYGSLGAMCSLATLLNPYGWRLHEHIVRYLGSSWIVDNVQEFQSPQIRSENMFVFVGLLLLGVSLVSRAFSRRQWFEGLLVLAWGFAALRSVRHVPLYVVAAAPLIAVECAACWERIAARWSPRSAGRVLGELAWDLGRSNRISCWTPILGIGALWLALPQGGIADFSGVRFPVAAVANNRDLLSPGGAMPRILTSDQFADYLIFNLHPSQRVFFDGRSDFYGPVIGSDYKRLLAVESGWRETLDHYGFQIALLPLDWSLGAILERDPEWHEVYRDAVSLLFVRRAAGLQKIGKTAECKSAGE